MKIGKEYINFKCWWTNSHHWEYSRYNNVFVRACKRKGCVTVDQCIITLESEPEELVANATTNFLHPSLKWKRVE